MILDNPTISGSLQISGSTTILGTLSASTIVGDGSYITFGGLTPISSSTQIQISESQITDLSHYTDTDTLSYLNSIGTISGSAQISYIEITDIPTNIVSSSAQLSTEISGAFTSTSASLALRTSTLEQFSSSLDTTFATDSELSSTSASLASDIQNNDTRLSTIEGKTLVSSSAQISYTGITDIPANIISSSAQLSNSTIPGNLTVGGILTAQEFHTEFVSASIIYQSGSTQFGNTVDDTHTFIGIVTSSNFAGDGSQLTSVLSMNQENFTLASTSNSITVTSGSLPSSNDKILIYYNGQFLNKTYISSKTTNTINLTFSASLGDQIDVVWYNFN